MALIQWRTPPTDIRRNRSQIATTDPVPVVGITGHGGAKARNLPHGDDQAELDLWDTKWIPEGHDYELAERPRERADVVLVAEG